jgi:hypothetical protein
MTPYFSVSNCNFICKARMTELDNELKKFTNTTEDHRRSVRKVMSRRVRALYPFREDTLRKLRDNISRVNEILQQAAGSVLMYVIFFLIRLLFTSFVETHYPFDILWERGALLFDSTSFQCPQTQLRANGRTTVARTTRCTTQ